MLCDYPTLWNRTTKLWLNNAGVMPHHLSNGKTFKQYVSHKMCKESKYLQFILKVSTSCIYAGMQTSMPLSDGFVDSFLIKTIPLQHNVLPKFLNILDSCLLNVFLQDPPDFIIYEIEVWSGWPQNWRDESGISRLSRSTVSHALWVRAPSCWKMKNSENFHISGRRPLINSWSR